MSIEQPLVSIVMGSESDLGVMRKCADLLDDLGVPHEVRIMSAHRTPDLVAEYASGAAERGLKVIIAGAGAAAALPGVVAAHTQLPVIGVPVDATALRGVDALYAIVQMPSGVPVATVGIDGSKNAAVLAARILALQDEEVGRSLDAMTSERAANVLETDKRVREEAQ
ncbi:MAG: 5-(carboxyamino)imidazole ribonucleotide mutase [Armatimonadia bacterium]|nr:5-(carboxyamino)imidazole ribonucleotide mutase [Armatimonadia bacterium]